MKNQNNSTSKQEAFCKINLPMWQIQLYGANFFAVLTMIFGGLYVAIWGAKAVGNGFSVFLEHQAYALLVPAVFVAGIALHELIHGLAFAVFNKHGHKTIRYGFSATRMIAYAHCTEPLRVRYLYVVLLAPMLVLGLLPVLVAMIIGNGPLLFFGIFFTAASVGDLLYVKRLSLLPLDAWVEDDPNEIGFWLHESTDGRRTFHPALSDQPPASGASRKLLVFVSIAVFLLVLVCGYQFGAMLARQ